MARPLPLLTPFDRTRASAFSYECRACGRCCRDKVIPLNPYEIARIAEHLGVTTTAALASFTDSGGAALRTKDDGRCTFFDEGSGCTVHPARPLACRLYPLGRYVDAEGRELFAEIAPQEGSEGIYGRSGVVDDYLRAQGVDPYLKATARYLDVLRELLPALAARQDASSVVDEATAAMSEPPAVGDENLLDVDAIVERVCSQKGIAIPASVDERIDLHLAFLADLARS